MAFKGLRTSCSVLLTKHLWVIKSIRIRWIGHVAHVRDREGAYRVLVGRPEGRRPLGRPRRRWKDNIKVDL